MVGAQEGRAVRKTARPIRQWLAFKRRDSSEHINIQRVGSFCSVRVLPSEPANMLLCQVAATFVLVYWQLPTCIKGRTIMRTLARLTASGSLYSSCRMADCVLYRALYTTSSRARPRNVHCSHAASKGGVNSKSHRLATPRKVHFHRSHAVKKAVLQFSTPS